jgi:hypothetical protein
MWVSRPVTPPEDRACLFISPIPTVVQRLTAPAALHPDQCHDLLDCLAQVAHHDTAVADGTVGTVLAVAVAAMRAGCVNPAQGRMTS